MYQLYKISFTTPVKLSEKSGVSVILHSDTLFSALYSESIKLYGNDKFDLYDKLLISSGFPFVNEDLLLPKPLKTDLILNEKDKEQYDKKTIKNCAFMPLDFKIMKWDFCKITQRPNVSSARDGGDNSLFYTEIVSFNKDCGLWFLSNLDLDELLKSLGSTGIGGDRSVGLGKFTFKKEQVPEQLNKLLTAKIGYKMSLSVISPTEQDFTNNFENSYYKLLARDNWTDNNKNKSINMFCEGSCFNFDLVGEIKDICYTNCEHPVYKYGKNISIGVENAK